MQYTIIKRGVTSTLRPVYVKCCSHQHVNSTSSSNCHSQYNFAFINFYTIYNSNASMQDNVQLHYKQVNDCILKTALNNKRLDSTAHFILLTVNNTFFERYESYFIAFTHHNPILYQEELFKALQKLNVDDAIHCNYHTHFSLDTLIQSIIDNVQCIPIRVYSNCSACLNLCRLQIK